MRRAALILSVLAALALGSTAGPGQTCSPGGSTTLPPPGFLGPPVCK